MAYANTLIDKPCIEQTGTTDAGRGIFGTLLAGASILSAAYNAYRAVELATKEWEMAKRYWRLAQNWLEYYRNYYAPVEDQEISEALALKKEEPDYETARGRARAVAWLQFRDVMRQSVRCTSRYCTGLRQDMLTDLSAAQADAVTLADGLGYRNERAYIESRDDVRFKKMHETAKRGRDIVADNVSLAASAAGIYGSLFEQAWEGFNGAGQYLGYWANRNNTQYPGVYVNTFENTARKTGERTQAAGVGSARDDRPMIIEEWQGAKPAPKRSPIQERDI